MKVLIEKCKKKEIVMFNKKPIIKFVSTIPELEKEEKLHPRPYKSFMPEWWASIPNKLTNGEGTIKRCAGLADLFSQAYVVPMWMETKVDFIDSKEVSITKDNKFMFPEWELHPSDQLLDHTNINIGNNIVTHTLKVVSPWSIILPRGYSLLQLPVFYHFENRYSVIPGIIDSDIFHEANIPLFIHNNNKTLYFKEGEPFVMYIPFKRSKFKHSILGKKDKIYDRLIEDAELFFEIPKDQNPYRKLQKERDGGTLYKKNKNNRFEEKL
jgi:hypothetical protein